MKVVLINPYELGRQPFALAQPAAWRKEAGEPRRVCRRLQLLRGWSYDEENIGKIFT